MDAYNLFQNSVAELDERSFRAQAAILNGLLTHHLDSMHGKCVDLRKIGLLLDHFDRLVLRSECLLAQNANISLLRCLVKCSFYCRFADFLLCSSIYQQSFNEFRLLAMAMFCYGLALKWACHKSVKGGNGADNALLSLCAAELTTLLRTNLHADSQLEAEMHECDRNMLLSFLRCYSSSVPPKDCAQFGTSVTSFLQIDTTDPIALSELRFDVLPLLLANAWPLRRNTHFLRRLAFIFAYSSNLNYHRVLDPLLVGLSKCSVRENDFLCCSPENVTITDVKIFLVRLSSYMKMYKLYDEGVFVFPWIFHCAPNVQQQQFWSYVCSLLDGKQESESLPTLVSITNSLEQIRFVDDFADFLPSSSRDVSHLAETMQILENLAELTTNDEEKQIFYLMAEKCATAAKKTIDGSLLQRETTTTDEEFAFGSRKIRKALFPALGQNQFEPIRSDVIEKIDQFFSKKLERQTAQASENLVIKKEGEIEHEADNRCFAPQLTSESTQTDEITTQELPKNDQNEAAMSKKLEDINTLMTRLTLHNRSLAKLFALNQTGSLF
ncbi:hypothetical protein niasHT_030611 [Heterodera trifolii]|uniref:Uncharacterized protein n=1 Tax=Heterodera trifolii TaxID=157864 RepID=A0ABD2IS94_9BILA